MTADHSTLETLWSSFEAAAATGGHLLSSQGQGAEDATWSVSGLSIDTRTLRSGDMFIALQGARDGHDFLSEAYASGARVAMVSRVPAGVPVGMSLLKVADTLKATERLARAARDRCFGRFVAVTGSAGKTSTKEMLRHALARSGRVHAAAKSFNNHIGVPLTLASLPARSEFGVFEIGMNHAGEITPLSAMVAPHVAIITTVAAAHLENFDSIDGIAAAKAEILSGVRPGGAAVLPADNAYFDYLSGAAGEAGIARVLPFGESPVAARGVRLLGFTPSASGLAAITCEAIGRQYTFEFASPGKHQAMNAMAVLAAAMAVGLPIEKAIEGLAEFAPGEGRGAARDVVIDGKRLTLIDESYNANPASMAAAFTVLAATKPRGAGRRIAVLGEMKELGPTSRDLHAGLAAPIAAAGTELVFTAGDDFEALRDVLPTDVCAAHGDTATDLLGPLLGHLIDGDVILFKGSNASQVGKLVNALLAKSREQG